MNDVNRERILIGGSVLLGSGIGIISPSKSIFVVICLTIGVILYLFNVNTILFWKKYK